LDFDIIKCVGNTATNKAMMPGKYCGVYAFAFQQRPLIVLSAFGLGKYGGIILNII
jgi:hypothetical protein